MPAHKLKSPPIERRLGMLIPIKSPPDTTRDTAPLHLLPEPERALFPWGAAEPELLQTSFAGAGIPVPGLRRASPPPRRRITPPPASGQPPLFLCKPPQAGRFHGFILSRRPGFRKRPSRPAARRENAALKKRARDGILVKLSYFPL